MKATACRAYKSCQQLRSLLLEAGSDTGEIRACPDEDKHWPCDEMLCNSKLLFQLVSPGMAGKVVRFVSTLFPNPSDVFSQDVRRLMSETPFHCPDIDIDIYQPCGVNSCSFFTDNRWTRNCILYYRVRHERDSLSVNELSFLLGHDVPTIRNELTRTLKSLSQGALKETIVQEGVQEQVTHLEIDKLCCVCEKPVGSKSRKIVRSGLVYCSRACHQKKPPVVVGIERTFGLPIARLLELCVDKFGSVKNMSGALGIGQNTFLELCRRYDISPHQASPE